MAPTDVAVAIHVRRANNRASPAVGRYRLAMARIVLINGAPGSGKSTIAHALAQDRPMTLALDIDGIKHALGRWQEDPVATGLHARRLALSLAGEHLQAGCDVVLGQYLARTPFIEDLERLAERHGARFDELVLDLDAAALSRRLAERASTPDRAEHMVNNRLVGPDDANALVRTIESLRERRPHARWVDASGPLASTLAAVRAALREPSPDITR
jgi:predicted kinase